MTENNWIFAKKTKKREREREGACELERRNRRRGRIRGINRGRSNCRALMVMIRLRCVRHKFREKAMMTLVTRLVRHVRHNYQRSMMIFNYKHATVANSNQWLQRGGISAFERAQKRMEAYLAVVKNLTQQFKTVELIRIPRGENSSVDVLATLASTSDPGIKRAIPVECISSWSIMK